MKESFEWIMGLLTVMLAIAGIVSNARKKREEQAAAGSGSIPRAGSNNPHAGTGAGSKGVNAGTKSGAGMGMGTATGSRTGADMATGRRANPIPRSFADVLEELSRSLTDQPSPPPAATSYDYYSLENEYDASDGRGYRDDYTAEDSDAEQRYIGGEFLGSGNKSYGAGGDLPGTSVSAHTPSHRSLSVPASIETASGLSGAGSSDLPASDPANSAGFLMTESDSPTDANRTTLQELLEGDFDLRRAVIEAEILTPKYV